LQIGTAGTFDAEAYKQSLAANAALQQAIKAKRHGSAAEEGQHAVALPYSNSRAYADHLQGRLPPQAVHKLFSTWCEQLLTATIQVYVTTQQVLKTRVRGAP
jgi:hypothetical protein